ncbi:MAG: SPOR domain-containing protein [Burkholderiales bacterium]|nr:SPOR domain-containing protein [Burkholderiales bacterium]
MGIGVVGFPLVFETQPRPIPIDIPIEVPRKEGAPPLVMPAGAPDVAVQAAATSASAAPAVAPAPAPRHDVTTETRQESGRDVAASGAAPASAAPAKTTEPALPRTTATATAKPMAEPPPAAPPADGARAKALLDGKPVASAGSGRFVVQVGAFADAGAARETRLRVEKLGLKTYTQVAATPAGNRIRVRVGPYATRIEADKALAKARGAGLNAVVLTL